MISKGKYFHSLKRNTLLLICVSILFWLSIVYTFSSDASNSQMEYSANKIENERILIPKQNKDSVLIKEKRKEKVVLKKDNKSLGIPSNTNKTTPVIITAEPNNVIVNPDPVLQEEDESNMYMPSNEQNRCETQESDNNMQVVGDSATLVPEIRK